MRLTSVYTGQLITGQVETGYEFWPDHKYIGQGKLQSLENVRRYQPCLTKVYCCNYVMIKDNFLKTFLKEIESLYIYASQCGSDKSTVTGVVI